MKPLTKKQIFDLNTKYSHIYPVKGNGKLFKEWWTDCYAWINLCMNVKLSEEFMRDFKDQLIWRTICYFQPSILSEEFIIEMVKEGYITDRMMINE